MIKIKDLLDFSSLPAPSTFRVHAPPQSTRTVHHRPPHYEATRESARVKQDGGKIVKTEATWKEGRCPNVVIKNGKICAFERRLNRDEETSSNYRDTNYKDTMRKASKEETNERKKKVKDAASGGVEDKISYQFGSPQSDSKATQYLTKSQKKRLFLTKKLLDLKKSAKKNHRMAVNLESLLPQALPSGGIDDFQQSEFTVHNSTFWNENEFGTGSEGTATEYMSLDDLYYMADNFYPETSQKEFEKVDYEQITPAQTPDLYYHDAWATTTMSLPPTPEGVTPNSPSVFMPCPSATPTLMSLPTYQQSPLPSHPLTPDSIQSPHSCAGEKTEDLSDILSFLQEPELPLASENDHFQSFQLPLASCDQQSGGVSSADDGSSSVYCSSFLSSPQSPLSPNVNSFTPTDTIRDLLAQTHGDDELSSNVSTPSSKCVEFDMSSSLKRKSDSSVDDFGSKKRAIASSVPRVPRSKKRGITGNRKERKREQNKTAALRYRQKKKDEKLDDDVQQSILEEKNTMLKNTLSSLEAEVEYLKKLWGEVELARRKQSQLM